MELNGGLFMSLGSPIYAVAMAHRHRRVFTGDVSRNIIMWDVAGRFARRVAAQHVIENEALVLALAVVPDDSRVVASLFTGTLLVVDVSYSPPSMAIARTLANASQLRVAALSLHSGFILTGSLDATARLRSIDKPETVLHTWTFAEEEVTAVKLLSATRGLIAAGSTLYVFDLERPGNGHVERELGGGAILCVAGRGHAAAVGCEDWSLHFLTGDRFDTAKRLDGHYQSVTSVAFSPGGRRLASSSYDVVLVWDVSDARRVVLLHTLACANWTYSMSWSARGTMLVTGGNDRIARVWGVGERALRAMATLLLAAKKKPWAALPKEVFVLVSEMLYYDV